MVLAAQAAVFSTRVAYALSFDLGQCRRLWAALGPEQEVTGWRRFLGGQAGSATGLTGGGMPWLGKRTGKRCPRSAWTASR